MQSLQHSQRFEIYSSVCSFCLSINRRTTPALQLSQRWLNWTPFKIYSPNTPICWECKARLRNYSEFCERAERAQTLLNQLNTQESLNGKSLSRLVTSSTLVISVDPQIQEDVETIKSEPEELKEEGDFLTDFETGNDEETDYYYETEYSNNCDESMTEDNMLLKKDDDFVGNNADKDEHIDIGAYVEITVEDTPNVTNTKNTPLCVKKSDANFSQNFEIDYEIYEKFTATEDEMRESLKPISHVNKCRVCLREFKSIQDFMDHIKDFHSGCGGEHKCDICGFGQPTEAALNLHREEHYVLYRCLVEGCSFVHKYPPTLKAHQTSHENPEKVADTYVCSHCDKRFKKRGSVYKHIIQNHMDSTKCKHCSEDFPDRKSLHQHIKLLHVDKLLMCDVCGLQFVTLERLQAHLNSHRTLNQQKFSCKICKKSFSDKFKVRLHQFAHNDKPRIRCHICKTEFIEEEARIKHLESRHGVTREEASKVPPVNPRRSRRREVSKTLPTYCELCGEDFKYPSILEHHVSTRHSENRPFKCHICGDGFKTKIILDNHIRKHSDERAFTCDVCDKSFKYSANLYTHKVLHTGEKPYMCTICGASFALNGNLKGHMMIHTGERPFECNVCAKKFPSRSCLKKHARIH